MTGAGIAVVVDAIVVGAGVIIGGGAPIPFQMLPPSCPGTGCLYSLPSGSLLLVSMITPASFKDISGAGVGDVLVDVDLVELRLRLHVELFQLVEDLLEVEAVLGQDEDGAVDGGDAHFGFALGVDIDLDLSPGLASVLSELDLDLLRVVRVDVEGQVVGGDLAVGQYLVDESLETGAISGVVAKAISLVLREAGEDDLAAGDDLVVEVGGLSG